MKKINIRLLIISIVLVSITTLFNSIILYWMPIVIPISSFSAIRIVFFAFIGKKYWLLLFSFLICLLLLLTAVSIYKRHVLLPIFLLIYLIYDFITVLLLLIDGLGDGYWTTYIIQALILTVLISLLCGYILNYLQNHLHKRHWFCKLPFCISSGYSNVCMRR